MNKTGFPKTKCAAFSSLYLLFVILLWTCVFTWVQTTYESPCVNFFSAIRTHNKNCRKYGEISQVLVEDSLGLRELKNSPKNSFFLKINIRISTEFETKRDKFQVKQMSIHPRKK